VNTWKAIFAALVIFSAGGVTGGLLVWRLEPPPAHGRHNTGLRSGQLGSPSGMRFEFLRRAQRELDLTPEQRERIDKLLKDSQERTRRIMQPVAPEFHAELQRAKEEFRAVLTPEQQQHFDDLLKLQHRSHDHLPPVITRTNSL
jgi:Spy/CpxP family protein refolding chaperone